MAFNATRVTVGTTAGGDAVVTDAATGGGTSVSIRNRGSVAVYLGASGVATTTGYQLDPGEALGLMLENAESVYGIVTSGSAVVHVLKGGA